MKGTIVRLFRLKGYGFIKGDEDGLEYFMHARELHPGTIWENLAETDVMEFEAAESDKGPRAKGIRKIR